jgi:hypothetical protein
MPRALAETHREFGQDYTVSKEPVLGHAPLPFGLNELGFSRPCRSGSHLAAARVGRFGWVAMIGTVLWCGVRYACADDGVTIA